MKTKSLQPKWRETAFRLLAMIVASLAFAANYKSFVQTGDLFPGGFNGVTRLIQRCALEYWGVVIPFSPVSLVLNAIPALISFKFVGKHFTLYSCVVIVLTGFFTDMIPSMPITEDVLLISVFGGLINGLGSALCLYAGVCGGGTDFIAIAVSERKNMDAWNYILCCNAVLLVVAGLLFGWDKALYSIIFQFTVTQVVRTLDPEGRRATLFIVTGRETAGGVCAQIQDTNHSATLVEGVGLYNGTSCVLIYTVVSGSQVRRLVRRVRQADPNAFVNVMRTEKLSGRFLPQSKKVKKRRTAGVLAGCPPLHFDKNDKIEEGKDGLQMLTQNGDKKRKEKEKTDGIYAFVMYGSRFPGAKSDHLIGTPWRSGRESGRSDVQRCG